MRLRLTSLLCTVIVWSMVSPVQAQPPKASIAFILDCSRSMGDAAEREPGVRQTSGSEESTRMEAAQSMLRKMLRDLAADNQYHVGVWLYGHRLVWEAGVKQPDLLSQDDYLEATVGFAALNGLLPGDDVEQVQAMQPFGEVDYQRMAVRLEVVKPWGEKPLYLAINRALQGLADQAASAPKCVIVLTDGGNEQWLARYKTTRDQTTDALRHNIVPIHCLHFGPHPEEGDTTEQELREIVEQGGGSLRHVTDSTQLSVSQVLSTSRKVPVRPVSASSEDENDEDSVEGKIDAAKAVLARPADRTISGSVVYYGKPVNSATITLEGTSIPAVKTDRQGNFLIRKVPAGRQYRVKVKAIALNSIREKAVELNVEQDDQEQPFVTIDLK